MSDAHFIHACACVGIRFNRRVAFELQPLQHDVESNQSAISKRPAQISFDKADQIELKPVRVAKGAATDLVGDALPNKNQNKNKNKNKNSKQ